MHSTGRKLARLPGPAVLENPRQVLLPFFAAEPAPANPAAGETANGKNTSTFLDNMRLPVHRWFRYSAGFSAEWVKQEIRSRQGKPVRLLDPFAGSATTCLAADETGVPSIGLEAHPFVCRVAAAKLNYHASPGRFTGLASEAFKRAAKLTADHESHSTLILKCYGRENLDMLERFRQAVAQLQDGTPEAALLWLALVSSLRSASAAGTAPWQYVLPGRRKTIPPGSELVLRKTIEMMAGDMRVMAAAAKPLAKLNSDDARTCSTVPDNWATLVLTSPPYANNYDYADATRLEMSFLGEISGWGDLQDTIRTHLVRSCSQHVPPKSVDWGKIVADPVLEPIATELRDVCAQLTAVRMERGGKKTYNNMIACYFHDLARVWHSLRRCTADGAEVCFVIGDSAPYGIYVPVVDWLGRLATAAGFKSWQFDKLRDRNVKWKNRKHRVPLCEGRLWVQG